MVQDKWLGLVEKLCGKADSRPSKDAKPQIQPAIPTNKDSIKPPLHALVIGINDYQNHTKLQAAIPDAEAFKAYLMQALSVPEHQITFLRNQQANRAGILAGFHKLINDDNIHQGDPIVIYYAGHGGEIEPPAELIDHGPLIQCIIPQDTGTKSSPGAAPIPDFTIGALLDKLSLAKGNNITVIFDCCHSAGGSRDDADPSRFINSEALPPLPAKVDSDLVSDVLIGSRDITVPEGFAGQAMGSHILIAACAHGESAYEDRSTGRGYFTAALLDIMAKGVDNLTYKGLMQRFPRLQPRGGSQNPVCEGYNVDRILFNAKVLGADSSFIIVKAEGQRHYLQAGLAQGITPGSTFAIHSSLIVGPNNPVLGTMVVDQSEPFRALLKAPDGVSSFKMPQEAYARQIGCGSDRALDVFFAEEFVNAAEPDELWESAFSGMEANMMIRPAEREFAQIAVELDPDQKAKFRIRNQAANKHGVDTLLQPVRAEAALVLRVLQAAAKWNWHFQRAPGSRPFQRAVEVEFYRLVERGYDAVGHRIMAPRGENLNRRGEADIVARKGDFYGLKIVNNSTRNLYAYPFYFSVRSQAIFPLFTKVIGGGRIDPSLPSKRTTLGGNFVTVGYGAGGVYPFEFYLADDSDIDVGFYKVFLTTSPTDFDSIELYSPFDENARAVVLEEEVEEAIGSQDLWDVVTMTLIQRRHPTDPESRTDPLLTAESPGPVKIRAFSKPNSQPWFRTPPLSQEILSNASYLKLSAQSREQGPANRAPTEGKKTWFSICIIGDDDLAKLGPDEEVMLWESHANQPTDPSITDTLWIEGQAFDRKHEIWNHVQAGDSFEVFVVAHDRGWVNIADAGVLEVW